MGCPYRSNEKGVIVCEGEDLERINLAFRFVLISQPIGEKNRFNCPKQDQIYDVQRLVDINRHSQSAIDTLFWTLLIPSSRLLRPTFGEDSQR